MQWPCLGKGKLSTKSNERNPTYLLMKDSGCHLRKKENCVLVTDFGYSTLGTRRTRWRLPNLACSMLVLVATPRSNTTDWGLPIFGDTLAKDPPLISDSTFQHGLNELASVSESKSPLWNYTHLVKTESPQGFELWSSCWSKHSPSRTVCIVSFECQSAAPQTFRNTVLWP